MKENLLTIVSIICLFIIGCSGGNVQENQNGKVIPLSKESFQLDETFFSQIGLVPLETTEQALIRDIDAVSMAGDTLFLLDGRQRKVFIFLTDGKSVNVIQDIGNGPKEYSRIVDIDVHNGTLAVLCDGPTKMMYYTYDGKFIKEQSLNDYWEHIASTGNGFSLYGAGSLGKRTINILDESSGIETILPQPDGRFVAREAREPGTIYSYGGGRFLTRSNEVLFTWPFDYTIYTIQEGKPQPCYTLDFGKQALPDELLELGSDDFLKLCDEEKYIYTIRDIVANEDYLLFRANPWIFILDRKERELMRCGIIKNDLHLYDFYYLPVSGTEKLVQVYPAYRFKTQLEDVIKRDELPKNKLGEEVIRIHNEIDDEDNPVLLFYQLPKKPV